MLFHQTILKWDPHGIYQDLLRLLPVARWHTFPVVEQLTQMLPEDTVNSAGMPIRFVGQQQLDAEDDGLYYEARIGQTGAVATRLENWHDLFNALIWALFPRSKRLISQQHCEDIAEYGAQQRTPRRNALTLFDECGVIMATADPALANQLKQHEWLSLFWQQRQAWGSTIRPFVFGHASYESYLTPFVGLCGKALCLPVAASFFALPLAEQYVELDRQLALALQDGLLANNRALSPLPLLGIPGWWPENETASFYANTDYFCPLPKHRRSQ